MYYGKKELDVIQVLEIREKVEWNRGKIRKFKKNRLHIAKKFCMIGIA